MIALAAIILIIILFFTYLLFMPLSVNLYYAIDEKTLRKSSIKLFPFEYHFKDEKREKEKPKKLKTKKPKVKKPRRKKVNVPNLIQSEYKTFKVVLIDAAKLIVGLIKAPHVEDFSVALNGSFAGPDMTGMLYGGVMAVRSVLPNKGLLTFNPDFQADKLGGYVKAVAAIRLYEIVKQLLLFIWRLPKLHLIKLYFRLKKGG